MDDVVIAGGGPAGAFAALILARAGVRVRVFERARFPRHKLCGDTLNPGALAVLARHVETAPLVAKSDDIHGMLITGPGRVTVRGLYGGGITGRAVTRRVFDEWLLREAAAAGAQVEEGAAIKGAHVADGRVSGVMVAADAGAVVAHQGRLVIAADGRRSTLAFTRGLARQPARPRRWAIGAYCTDVAGCSTVGEMHVREGHYIGVAPVPGGLTNVCVVMPHAAGDPPFGSPMDLIRSRLDADPELRNRFAAARPVGEPVMLGPMAVDADAAGEPGLLLAGDAAGFIDPMTGDGLRLALAGAEHAAAVALDVLAGSLSPQTAHLELARRRCAAFAAKWRFNRALRSLVTYPQGVTTAALAARVMPSVFQAVIRYAGDCGTGPANRLRQGYGGSRSRTPHQ
ncbi:MAG: FAD-dependent monooxygenase [Acidobacteriota bacterium]|nr:FAD-dependent monooxygenase [Acidobacteriota bacterium]